MVQLFDITFKNPSFFIKYCEISPIKNTYREKIN